jgi:ornithine cyclodeaminase/alanine dehydrogenase-like protein (mu-crystallin family)
MREIEDDLVLKADTVLVDSRDACSLEAGELISSGIKKEDMVELGQLVGDDGAPDPAKVERLVKTSSITVFKSVGVGIQDVAIAHAVLGRAQALGFVSSIPYD